MLILAITSFSRFIVELFGQTIPNIILSFFRDVGEIIILASVFIFVIIWFLNTRHHMRPKNYSIFIFDVYGDKTKIDGMRTEFMTHDVAWSFMKQYKKLFPIHNFALVSNIPNSEKKAIHRYI